MNIPVSDNRMPQVLEKIIAEINKFRHKDKSNIYEFSDNWTEFTSSVKKEIPEIISEGNNNTLRYGELSPGCFLCRKGKWDCIFITMACNLECSFCYSPRKVRREQPGSAYENKEEIIADNYKKLSIKGIGFTGGEPLLEFQSLMSWFKSLKSLLPDNYFWIYTNGLLLNERYVDILSDNGLNEIRFNMAATNYNNPDILSIIKYASKKISKITVEIPAIWNDKQILISSLTSWVSAGVKYLNLHELINEPGSNSEMLNGCYSTLILKDGHGTGISIQSKTLILDIIRYVKKNKIPLNINVCSIINKIKQVNDRRNNLGRLVKKTYEKILDREFLETILIYKDNNDFRFIHPELYDQEKYMTYNAVRLIRHAPLSIYDNEEKYFEIHKIR